MTDIELELAEEARPRCPGSSDKARGFSALEQIQARETSVRGCC